MLNIKAADETQVLTAAIVDRARQCREGQEVVFNAFEILGRDATYHSNVTDALWQVRKLGLIEMKKVDNGYGGFDVSHIATAKAAASLRS